MPPPALAKIANLDAWLKPQKTDGAQHSASPNKNENRIQKRAPKPQPRIDFSRFPAEIQHMIWSEYLQKPACHAFKFVKTSTQRGHAWGMELHVLPNNLNNSAYRQWKSMLFSPKYKIRVGRYNSVEYMNARQMPSKLANVSFQTGFRRAMIDFQFLRVNARKVALDKATDLTILEFERGVNAPALHWFEHSTGRLDIAHVREYVQHLTRVAVHYKKSHNNSTSRGPFQCYCPSGAHLDCGLYKACPVEQACFLDCFPELKEFYYVVEVTKKNELAWKADYKDHVRQRGYKLKTSKDPARPPFELQRFYDTKFEYVQLCPESFFEFLPSKLRYNKAVPLDAMAEGGPRECLLKVRDVYRGKLFNETFKNSAEERNKVKFGILFAYPIEYEKRDD